MAIQDNPLDLLTVIIDQHSEAMAGAASPPTFHAWLTNIRRQLRDAEPVTVPVAAAVDASEASDASDSAGPAVKVARPRRGKARAAAEPEPDAPTDSDDSAQPGPDGADDSTDDDTTAA